MQKKSNNKITVAIQFLFYTLILLVPLIMYSGTSELFEFNKMLFIYLIATFVGFLGAADIILHKRKLHLPAIITYSSLLFLISQTLSTFFSIDFHTSLFGYYGRFNGGLFSIIAYIMLLYTFIQYFNAATLQKILKTSLISSTMVILWGLPGKIGYDLSCLLFTGTLNNTCWTDQFRPSERMFSTLGQPNWLGAYLAIHLFIGLYFLIMAYKGRSIFNKIIMFIYIFLNFSAILFTRSRSTLGAVLICLALLPVCLLFINFRKQKVFQSLKIYLYIIIVAVISIAIFQTGIAKVDSIIGYIPNHFPVRNSHPLVSAKAVSRAKQTQIISSGVTDSFDIRKIVWKGAIDLGKRYPFFGTGVETFAYSYYFVRPVEHNLTSEWDFLYNKAHNEFLNYFATTGYTGIITYLLMIVSVFYIGISATLKFKKSDPDTKQANYPLLIVCLLLSYITISITNFFGFSTTTVNVFFYLTPGFIYALSILDDENNVTKDHISIIRRVLLIIPITITLYIIFFLLQYFSADLQFNVAEGYTRSSDYQKAAVAYNDVMKIHYEHVYEDKLSYVLANLAYVAAYQKEKETSDNLLKLAQFYNQKSLNASPGNINYWKTSVKNDYLFYQTELNPKYIKDGLDRLKTAREISPTDPKLPYSQALFYSVLEDEEKDPATKQTLQQKSLESINTAIKLKSDYRDSYFLKGQLLKKYGKKDEAKKVFRFIIDHFDPNDTEVKKEIGEL